MIRKVGSWNPGSQIIDTVTLLDLKRSHDFLSDDESEKKTLSESAAEYTETHTNKRKYDVVDVVTGIRVRTRPDDIPSFQFVKIGV